MTVHSFSTQHKTLGIKLETYEKADE